MEDNSENLNQNIPANAENLPEKTNAPFEPPKEEAAQAETREEETNAEIKAEEKSTDVQEPVQEPINEPTSGGQPEAKVLPPVDGEKKWYVVQTLTGQEDTAKRALEQTIENEGLQNRVFQVLVPVEETVEIKGGKRHERVRKMFPGYVFIEMILDEETWYLIRQTSGVARFIGTKVSPTPVSDKEMQRVLKQLGKEERLEVTFEKGEGVRVISGAFRGYTGIVDEINAEKGKMKVLINIFGRDTPVEVNFEHAQKIV